MPLSIDTKHKNIDPLLGVARQEYTLYSAMTAIAVIRMPLHKSHDCNCSHPMAMG